MERRLSFRCEKCTINPAGLAVIDGECMIGPIHEGNAVVALMHDDQAEQAVTWTIVKVVPWRDSRRAVLDRLSKGTLTLRGSGVNAVEVGDLLLGEVRGS